jgi:hypothetical protein
MKKLIQVFLTVWILLAMLSRADAQSVSPSKNIFAPYEVIVVRYAGFPGNARDWIGIAAKGLADDKYTIWKYTDGGASGSVTLDGLPYGEYEVRAYFDNGNVVKARASIRVGNADQNLSAKTEKPNYKPNEKIVVVYSGLPGHGKDWIGLAKPGTADDQYLVWQYTNAQQAGRLEFQALPEGSYEVRSYFNNENTIRTRHPFTVSNAPATDPNQLCRTPLSVFFAGLSGLGAAWARTTCEPTVMSPTGVTDIQGALRNTRDGLDAMKDCYSFDTGELNSLIGRIPSLTNVQAEAEIHALVRKLQEIISRSNAVCDNRISILSLYVAAVHLGAAQAHSSCRQCQPAPMPMAFQTVIRNHLNTARDAFANILPCVPGVTLSQFDAVTLGSANSLAAHTHIVGLHINLLWNISLSDCCCDCR